MPPHVRSKNICHVTCKGCWWKLPLALDHGSSRLRNLKPRLEDTVNDVPLSTTRPANQKLFGCALRHKILPWAEADDHRNLQTCRTLDLLLIFGLSNTQLPETPDDYTVLGISRELLLICTDLYTRIRAIMVTPDVTRSHEASLRRPIRHISPDNTCFKAQIETPNKSPQC